MLLVNRGHLAVGGERGGCNAAENVKRRRKAALRGGELSTKLTERGEDRYGSWAPCGTAEKRWLRILVEEGSPLPFVNRGCGAFVNAPYDGRVRIGPLV